MALRTSKLAASGTGVIKLDRAYLSSPSTFPLSLPLPGRPKRSANRSWLTSSVNTRVRGRLPSPQIFATAILRLSYRIDSGTPRRTQTPLRGHRGTPSQKHLGVSHGYALTKHASDWGKSMQKKCSFCRTPPITPNASPKSAWACPGECDSGTNVSRPRARPIRTLSFTTAWPPANPYSSRSRSKIRLAVCRCLVGARWSASRIASITGKSRPNLGLEIGSVRVYPAAAKTGTSSAASPGSNQTPAPPYGGCGSPGRRNVERRRKLSRQTSPAAPHKGPA